MAIEPASFMNGRSENPGPSLEHENAVLRARVRELEDQLSKTQGDRDAYRKCLEESLWTGVSGQEEAEWTQILQEPKEDQASFQRFVDQLKERLLAA